MCRTFNMYQVKYLLVQVENGKIKSREVIPQKINIKKNHKNESEKKIKKNFHAFCLVLSGADSNPVKTPYPDPTQRTHCTQNSW